MFLNMTSWCYNALLHTVVVFRMQSFNLKCAKPKLSDVITLQIPHVNLVSNNKVDFVQFKIMKFAHTLGNCVT